jgi:hypothetical protein
MVSYEQETILENPAPRLTYPQVSITRRNPACFIPLCQNRILIS